MEKWHENAPPEAGGAGNGWLDELVFPYHIVSVPHRSVDDVARLEVGDSSNGATSDRARVVVNQLLAYSFAGTAAFG